MNDYVNIMNIYQGDDIPTDDELLLFSESEDEEEIPKKPKKYLNLIYNG